jgi:hypothetical protein
MYYKGLDEVNGLRIMKMAIISFSLVLCESMPILARFICLYMYKYENI